MNEDTYIYNINSYGKIKIKIETKMAPCQNKKKVRGTNGQKGGQYKKNFFPSSKIFGRSLQYG
ncbi:hypothetical protein D0441_03495 [Priestia megaterium]|nr:hypothetical protein D0441_03495 [Priestia megaterium]